MTVGYFGIHPNDDPGIMEDSRSEDPPPDTDSEVIDPDVEISDNATWFTQAG